MCYSASQTCSDEGRLRRVESLAVNVSPASCFYTYFQMSGKARNTEKSQMSV